VSRFLGLCLGINLSSERVAKHPKITGTFKSEGNYKSSIEHLHLTQMGLDTCCVMCKFIDFIGENNYYIVTLMWWLVKWTVSRTCHSFEDCSKFFVTMISGVYWYEVLLKCFSLQHASVVWGVSNMESDVWHQGPYAKHCLSCYFQTKVELRRRSVYVRMQNDVLRLVGRLLPNYL